MKLAKLSVEIATEMISTVKVTFRMYSPSVFGKPHSGVYRMKRFELSWKAPLFFWAQNMIFLIAIKMLLLRVVLFYPKCFPTPPGFNREGQLNVTNLFSLKLR